MIHILVFLVLISILLTVVGLFMGRSNEWETQGKIMMLLGLLVFVLSIVSVSVLKSFEMGQKNETQQQLNAPIGSQMERQLQKRFDQEKANINPNAVNQAAPVAAEDKAAPK